MHPSTICASSTVMTHTCDVGQTGLLGIFLWAHAHALSAFGIWKQGRERHIVTLIMVQDPFPWILFVPDNKGLARAPPYSRGLFHFNVIFCEISRTVKYQIISPICIATITDNTNIHSISLLIFSLRSFYPCAISFILCILLLKCSCRGETSCGDTIYYAHAEL